MERDPRYDDILDLDRPPSPGHPPMSMLARAAQFSPFAALTGYEEAIEEAARLTDARLEGGEEEDRQLNEQLLRLRERIREKPLIRVTCFVPDASKEGGEYVTVTGRLRKLNETEQWLQLEDGFRAAFSDLLEAEEIPPKAGEAPLDTLSEKEN